MRPLFIVSAYPQPGSPLLLPRGIANGRVATPLIVVRQPHLRPPHMRQPHLRQTYLRRRSPIAKVARLVVGTLRAIRAVVGAAFVTRDAMTMVALAFMAAGFVVLFSGCVGQRSPMLAAPDLTLERVGIGSGIGGGVQTIYCTPVNNSRLPVDGGYFNVADPLPRWACRAGAAASGTYHSDEIPDGYAPSAQQQFDWIGVGSPTQIAWVGTGKRKSIPDIAGGRELQELVTLYAAW